MELRRRTHPTPAPMLRSGDLTGGRLERLPAPWGCHGDRIGVVGDMVVATLAACRAAEPLGSAPLIG
ncbi:hypothetical protein QM806_27620 [Rhodococcus sp. IEGM 1351]|uniref:hypothetical protein n=1 Tax=Rhodococcus sp. IEGM 1351 TaxID=3047089 RepID=UPI0022F2B055|nr:MULTISPECIES: hypothetical protein [Rhodococcus]MDI9939160.1 hypothetical protein [Rhodococcus sp. IEGM 1351]